MAMHVVSLSLCLCALAAAQVKPKDVRELGKGGSGNLPKLQALLKDPSVEVRVEAVKAITSIGTQRSLDPLIEAARDNDPEVQIRATDGLVNFYLPGYVQTGLTSTLKRAGSTVRGRFSDANDQVIGAYIDVRPEVVEAIARLVRGGAGMDARANAARAAGVLRAKAAIPDLLAALRTKDDTVIYESLVAIQKIRDPEAGPKVGFLLRDLNPRIQIAAIETAGLLRNQEAAPTLAEILRRSTDRNVRRAALSSLAMLGDPKQRETYQQFLKDKDDRLRGGAAEGLGRLQDPADQAVLRAAFDAENKTSPRLSMAFALVNLGDRQLTEFSPLQYLINTLNSSAFRGEAFPLLVELARQPAVAALLPDPMLRGTRDEKTGLARVLAQSGGRDAAPALEKLTHDSDPQVAREALSAMRAVQARN